MKFVIQRVTNAKCVVEESVIGQIEHGYCVFIAVSGTDTEEIADKMIKKLIGMRIFADEHGKINRSIADVNGSLLLISQFTLYANCRKGNRPSFTDSGNPELANQLYEYIIAECQKSVPNVQTGKFGADMKITLTNDGPFTIILDSADLAK